uniref:Uncharacterized protein n=1 Tax=Knipowitschia caucasica TaxID=637954 RepID=A0AAV2JSJ4_KNICA
MAPVCCRTSSTFSGPHMGVHYGHQAVSRESPPDGKQGSGCRRLLRHKMNRHQCKTLREPPRCPLDVSLGWESKESFVCWEKVQAVRVRLLLKEYLSLYG